MCTTAAGLHVPICLHLTEIPQHQSLGPFLLSPSRSRSQSMEEGTTALTRMFGGPTCAAVLSAATAAT